jgi:hypothetical protein
MEESFLACDILASRGYNQAEKLCRQRKAILISVPIRLSERGTYHTSTARGLGHISGLTRAVRRPYSDVWVIVGCAN